MLFRSKFVISPEGNGIDCHRHYEALIAGCIPIMESNPLIIKKYHGCPILYTSDYSEITEEYLLKKYDEMIDKVYDFSCLFLSHYPTDVQNYIRNCGNFWCNKLSNTHWYKDNNETKTNNNNKTKNNYSNLLFISVFNYGCIDIAHNHLESLKRNNIVCSIQSFGADCQF